jgi:fatty acid desaturase
MMTVLMVLLRLRGLAEHHGVANEHTLDNARSVAPSWIERAVIAPCNVSYHLEHHLFPSVPFYNLGRLHALLMQQPDFVAGAHRTAGYVGIRGGVVTELTSPDLPMWSGTSPVKR